MSTNTPIPLPTPILSDEFLTPYKTKKVPFGSIGYVVYKRTYARVIESENRTEEWWETCAREINNIVALGADFEKEEAEQFYDDCFNLRCSFSGRAKWQLGTKTVERIGGASMNNCWGVVVDDWRSFVFTFDMLMLGGGVGFNIQREFVHQLPKVKKDVHVTRKDTNDADYIVPDSREGWCDLLGKVMESYFETGKSFTYSTVCIRGKGVPIKGFGGISSGPEELCTGIDDITTILKSRESKKVRPIDCLDVMNIIARVVVSGNCRRSSQIAVGDMDDLAFLKAKRWDINSIPNWRSNSNNSIVCNDINHIPDVFWDSFSRDKNGNARGENYGLINLALSKKRGRVKDTHRQDKDVSVYNPCTAGDSLLLTEDGYQKMEDLCDKEIKIYDGDQWVDSKVWQSGIRDTIVLYFSNSQFLECTPDHLIEIYGPFGDGKKQWLTAKDCYDKYVETFAGKVVRVDRISEGQVNVPVYDFTSPKTNLGYVNGIPVHNCGEIGLAPPENTGEGEPCNLFELYLSRLDTLEDFKRVARYAYKVCKTIASMKYHWKNTDKLIHKNMRLGISVTGICEWIPKIGYKEAAYWLDTVYKELEVFDIDYSSEHFFNYSIKLTTVKPAGTSAKLPGTTSGVHPAYSKHYIQRIRFSSNDPLIPMLKKCGYPMEYKMEFDGSLDYDTVVVSFPIEAPKGAILAKDMTAIDQMELVKFMNTHWSDNSTSVTVYYKEEELDDIKNWLKANYNDYIKSISFLLHSDHGFKQAPYEEIDENTYNEMVKSVKPIENIIDSGGEIDTGECAGGMCPIK